MRCLSSGGRPAARARGRVLNIRRIIKRYIPRANIIYLSVIAAAQHSKEAVFTFFYPRRVCRALIGRAGAGRVVDPSNILSLVIRRSMREFNNY